MKILLYILSFASVWYIASALSWFSATMDPNNNTLYVIGDGKYPQGYTLPKPLFVIINGSDNYYLAVVGANGAKSLSLSNDGECLYVATESCILEVSGQGGRVKNIAGDCMEAGKRDGPLMYARFMSLTAVSTIKQDFWFMTIIDSGRINNVLLANSWSVREIGQVSGAFDISLVVERKGSNDKEEVEESIAILVLSHQSAFLIGGANDDRIGFIESNWKQHPIFSSTILTDDVYFTACLLQGDDSSIGNLTYTSYIMDTRGTLWVSLLLVNNNNLIENQVYKTTKVSSVNIISKLVWGKSLDGRILLKGLDIQSSSFIDLDINNNAVNESNSLELCTNPWQVVCDVGYIRKNQTCIQSPPGGYILGFTDFVQCPKGTYNPLPMAVSYAACKRCEPGFIASLKGSVVCSACSKGLDWQSASGDQCLSKCPPWNQDTEPFICKNCLPGSSFNQDKICQPCQAETSSILGGQCLQCAPNTSSPKGSKFCYKHCPAPNTCSNNGLRLCLPWNPPYLVSTIANLQNIHGKFLSMAICSNGTIFTGSDQGILVISFMGGGGSVALSYGGLDAMALSIDEMSLFIGVSGLVMKVANLGSEVIILARNITPQSMCVTVDGLYIVDGLSNSLLRLDEVTVVLYKGSSFTLLSVTPHEDKHSLVVLGTLTNVISIWKLSPDAGIWPLGNITTNSSMQWIVRWIKGKSTIGIGHAIVNIADSGSQEEIVAGGKMGHQDDEGQASRFISPIAAAAFTTNNEGLLLFLLEDQTSTIRTVYSRPCECSPNFYMLNGTCLPCSQNTYSMSGSRGCSTCPSGEYLDKYGYCMICPLTFWWYDIMYNPCRKMQGSNNQMTGLTLLEAQNWVAAGLDIVSTATILIPNSNEIPPTDILIKGDLLGRLWHISQSMTPKPFDPQGISIQSIPGMWALCSPVVFLGEECNCWHAPLRLGYDEIYKDWRESREQAAFAGVSNITHNSIYVLRPDDLHTISPILIINSGGSIKLNPKTAIGDMGLCFVGWPAQFNCTDPNYVWTFPSENYPGGACLPCPTGTISETHSSVQCIAISEKNPLCNPGTYKTFISLSNSYTCKVCPENTYSIRQGAIQCKPKVTLSCLPNFYVSNGGPISDNTCKPCVACIGESVMMPFLLNPCPGNTKIQPYVCVSWMQAIPGFFAYVNLNRVDIPITIIYNPCNNLPPYSVWDSGPYHDLCYFRCKFNVNQAMVKEYAFFFALGSSENEKRWPSGSDENLFPYISSVSNNNQINADRAMAAICSPCNTLACPMGMWRPLWADGCGPPCLISPNLCQGRSDGCVSICDVSKNAVVVAFGTDDKGRATCIWRCNIGWIKIKENNGSIVCTACNASLCEAGKKYIGNSQCKPEMLLTELCIPCPASEGGILNIKNSELGKCSYTCIDGYPNPSPQSQQQVACIQCAASVTRCPAGFRVTCALNPCLQCENPNTLSGRAVLVPTGDSICRVQCKPGFQTINIRDFAVISSLNIGHNPSEILCEECSKWPGLPCPTLSCSPGYQQKTNGNCTLCQTSIEMGCPEGTYAPECPGGGGVAQVGWCLTCPIHSLLVAKAVGDIIPGQWPTRKFVPYSLIKSGVTLLVDGGNDCATVCVDGSIQVKTPSSIICVACSSMLPAPPDNAPYKMYSSSWNASDGIRWWSPEFDPPHLSLQRSWLGNTIQMEKRAGICWPCPQHPLMGDPCFSSSFTDETTYGQLLEEKGIILHVDEPQQWFAWTSRRLLTFTSRQAELTLSCKPGSYPMSGSWCSVCPLDHYCIGGISQPVRCGSFFSATLGSHSAQNCTCRLGFAFNQISMECVLLNEVIECPPGFYKSPNSFQDKRLSAPCIPCPTGTYEIDGACQNCPLQSGSTEGSIQCKCLPGKQIIVLSSEESSSCQESCIIGSFLFDGSKCQTCSVSMAVVMPFPHTPCSCGPGTYHFQNRCEPCPKGTFSPTAGYAPCIICPDKMTTLYTGASMLAFCIYIL